MSQVVSFDDITPAARFDNIPWSQAIPEEAATSSGPWTTKATINLVPLDDDPEEPQPRSLTINDASDDPDLWYRFTFKDANGGLGQPSAPIQNTSREEAAATQFATSEEFATRLGITLTSEEADRADTLLALATGLIQRETRQTIFLVEDDVLTMPGTTDDMVKLPERPVIDVASVSLDGHALTEGGAWYRDGNTIVRASSTSVLLGVGLLTTGRLGFGHPRQTLEIVYTHGYDPIPDIVKGICLEAVVRVWVNPGAVARETVGNTATVYDNNRFSPAGLLLTSDEQAALTRSFGRQALSIAMGR